MSTTATSSSAAIPDRVAAHPSQALAETIQRLVAANRAHCRHLLLLEGLSIGVSGPLAYLWLVFLLDNQLHLPGWGFLASAGLLGIVGGLAVLLFRRRQQLRLSPDEVALAMERRTPGGVQNRLINALQIARDTRDAPELCAAVVEENCTHLQRMHLEQAARLRPALALAGLAVLLIGVGLAFWATRPEQFSNAATRILLPFADVAPLYRTILIVEPGNIEAAGDVTIRITIQGERPETLTILRQTAGRRSSEVVAVEPDADVVAHTLRGIEQSLTYAVQGGDFTSPFYRIDVPAHPLLSLVRVAYQLPDYTGLPEKRFESAGGDLEALQGTRADVTFVLDQPADAATLMLNPPAAKNAPQRLELTRLSPTEFRGQFVFENVTGYQIETRQGDRPPHRSAPYILRVLTDQEPKLDLSGLERQAEVPLEVVLPVQVSASDDYGLTQVGLFVRRVGADDDWRPMIVWPAGRATTFKQKYDLAVSTLGAGEGERLDVVLRGMDTDPLKAGHWTTGPSYRLIVGDDGVALQLQYEQILRSEAELKGLLAAQQTVLTEVAAWVRRLDGDDAKDFTAVHAAIKEQLAAQRQIRETAGRVAREMVPQAGNLRVGLGMLADTEVVRAGRIFESVPTRDQSQAKRAALVDARTTAERIVRGLQEMSDQYAAFRSDWELANMIPFTQMLAERQARLRDQSRRYAGEKTRPPAEALQTSMARRQIKVLELCGLIRPAFTGLADRLREQDPGVAAAFAGGAKALASAALQTPVRQAAEQAKAGRWAEAAQHQSTAADELAALHTRLRQAQADAAMRALAALKEKEQSDVEAQKAIAALKAGSAEHFLKGVSDKMKLDDIIHMQEVAQAGKKPADGKEHIENYLFPESKKHILQQKDSGKRQEFDILKLATKPTGEMSIPNQSDRKGNAVTPFIQEKFQDLVGKLLDEADVLKDKYETYNLNAAFNINEPGNIGKQGGDLNSTAASAATGNMKPPTGNFGGATRTGRQGARAHGMTVGDESINRRGRDKVQEGQERVADQVGTMKEKKSSDPQKDTSTGVGGKKVDSDESKFSVADAGKWTDDIAKRMDKAKAKNQIVERQGDRLDPKVADMLRDLTARQEQIIERVKTIRKELKNLYLPTDHLDELLGNLTANLEALKQRPEPELFRLQVQTLDRLRGTVRVFHTAQANFQPSLPREQVIRGRVLDEPSRPTLPGYEDAVKRYYDQLSAR